MGNFKELLTKAAFSLFIAWSVFIFLTGCDLNKTCQYNEACANSKYCAKAPGDCDEIGECTSKPNLCPDIWKPVCGCDGKTYGNDCEAAAAGVNVSLEGECGPIPCWNHDMCLTDEYCYFSVCGLKTGECSPRPAACPDVWEPVCGCDGKTYGNDCEAAAQGVNVDYNGECKPLPCFGNDMCSNVEYCYFAVCALETGECRPRPGACPTIWNPVCGCDGKTYGNDCEAAAKGVSVDYKSECKEPFACIDLWDPVCGCDGNTYSNDCYAKAAGVPVCGYGECGG